MTSDRTSPDPGSGKIGPTSEPARASLKPPRASMIDIDWLSEDTAATRTTETTLEVQPIARDRKCATLTVIGGVNAGQIFTIDREELLIGRGRDAHVRVEDTGVSRIHTRIVRSEEDKFYVEDMGSTNGTFVGGAKITRAELNAGDHVQIGPGVTLSFTFMGSAEEQLGRQLFESSTRDPLTRAYNRRYFLARVTSEIAYAIRHRTRLGVILFDLDHFKKVNDERGHLVGDDVLRAVSTAVGKMIRLEDVFARFGGEEFVILVRGIDHPSVVRFGDRVRKTVENVSIVSGEKGTENLRVTISVGVSSLSECSDAAKPEDLLRLADERLYDAKSAGRNCVRGA